MKKLLTLGVIVLAAPFLAAAAAYVVVRYAVSSPDVIVMWSEDE